MSYYLWMYAPRFSLFKISHSGLRKNKCLACSWRFASYMKKKKIIKCKLALLRSWSVGDFFTGPNFKSSTCWIIIYITQWSYVLSAWLKFVQLIFYLRWNPFSSWRWRGRLRILTKNKKLSVLFRNSQYGIHTYRPGLFLAQTVFLIKNLGYNKSAWIATNF